MRIRLQTKDLLICLAGTFNQLIWGIKCLEKLNPHNPQIGERIREMDAILPEMTGVAGAVLRKSVVNRFI